MTRREFHFVEGTSSKFWAVAVSDITMTVQFGKIGTAGQTQTKAFTSPDKARAEADKLIAEKTRKGYKEVVGAAEARTPVPAVAPAPAATPKPAPAPKAGVERRLRLSPEGWRPARWREQPPAVATPWPKPRPFDIKALRAAVIPDPYQMPADAFRRAGPPEAVTVQEARFWFHFLEAWSDHLKDLSNLGDVAEQLARLTPGLCERPVSAAQLTTGLIRSTEFDIDWPILKLFAPHLSPADFVEVVCSTKRDGYGPVVRGDEVAPWFEAEYLPRVAPADLDAVKAYLRGQLREVIAARAASAVGGPAFPVWERWSTAAYLAVPLDLEESRRYIECLTPPLEHTDGTVQTVLLGVRDREFVEREARRLQLPFALPYRDQQHDRAWLAHTEHAGLDHLAATFPAGGPVDTQKDALGAILLAESPEAARALMTVKVRLKSAPLIARVTKWFDAHPEHAVAGLTPLAEEDTEAGRAAAAWLEAHGRRAKPAAAQAASGVVAPEVRAALSAAKPPKKPLPGFADPGLVPPLPGMTADDVTLVLDALRGDGPVVEALRRHVDRPALAAFAWRLLENWLEAGGPPKENWALLALGSFGDDSTVRRLTPILRAWPGEGQHKRAVSGLEVLRAIGTDAALMALNGMALKLKFRGLQERARELMDLIATDRGLTREQLEDRIVPDLGLDADGTRTFDFGPRRFRLTLTDDLTPDLTDEAGKRVKDLPKPGAKDDAEKAAAAVAEWKEFKAQLRATLKVQVARLEEAMVTGRSWTPEEFRTLLVRHPLMSRLVRRLVWEGNAPFRVTEDGSALTHAGAPVSLDGTTIRVAHRLRLTPGQVGSWRIALDALGVEPPFPQLERPAFTPTEAEAAAVTFARPAGRLPATKVRGTLEGRGWRPHTGDGGAIYGFSKPYPAAGVTAAVLIAPGLSFGYHDEADQRVEAAFFVRGVEHESGGYAVMEREPRLRLADVDAVAFSETVRDLMSMAPPGK